MSQSNPAPSTSATESQVVEVLYRFAARMARDGRPVALPEPYDPSHPLQRCGVDSIVIAELAVDLEDTFRVELEFPRLARTRTLGEVVSLVRHTDGGATCPA